MDRKEAEGIEAALSMSAIERRVAELTGHKPSRSALHRWRLKNRLRFMRIGGRYYSTESAIREMLAADEQHNRGSANTRGTAAAARIESLAAKMPRRRGSRR